MTTLSTSFESDLREALLDDVETTLVGEEANLIFEFVELVHANLRAYGRRHDYNVESTIESLGTPQVQRTDNRVTVRVGWTSEQMARWEFGVSPHTINGKPVLTFVWSGENVPEWVKEEFEQARGSGGQFQEGWRVFFPEVEHPGIPESRAIRDSIRGLRRILEA